MQLAFIISAVIAGILFLLWESEGMISQLKNRIDELANDPSRAVYGRQTPLTPEQMHDVVRNNGFYPFQKEEEWISFKWQGEQYFISANTLPGIQFYKGFSYGSDTEVELFKKSAEEAMEETWYGRITFSEV